MRPTLHIWPEEGRVIDGMRERRAVVEAPERERFSLWFRTPESTPYPLTDSAEPFVLSLLFGAMQWNTPVHVHGPVSPSLLRNVEEYQTVWRCWDPVRHHAAPITVDAEVEPAPPATQDAISCFSGGVDACFTAFRHIRRDCGRQVRPLKACLMVHGFDIAVSDTADFQAAFENSQRLLAADGVPLVPVVTNFREMPLRWIEVFSTACGACLTLFQAHFRYGMIPSTNGYNYFAPHGSTPLTDRLMSSDGFSILNDGAGYARVDKVNVLGQWPDVTSHLRVCWEGAARDGNCGHCEKCIRTILDFRANGYPKPECFSRDATDEDIARLPVQSGSLLREYGLILQRALDNGMAGESWVQTLDKKVRSDKRHHWLAGIRRRVSLRTRLRRMAGLKQPDTPPLHPHEQR